jgi:hypothetical protein
MTRTGQKFQLQVNWPYLGKLIWRGITEPLGIIAKAGGIVMGIVSKAFGMMAFGTGVLVAPGLFHMTQQQNEYVTAKVTGRVQAFPDQKHASDRYFIFTDSTPKLDTLSLRDGSFIKEGCLMKFNLRGAKIQLFQWPPSYSRSVIGAEALSCPQVGK